MSEINRKLRFLPVGGTRVMSRDRFLHPEASGAGVVLVENNPKSRKRSLGKQEKVGGDSDGGGGPDSKEDKEGGRGNEDPEGGGRVGGGQATRKCECTCLRQRTRRTNTFWRFISSTSSWQRIIDAPTGALGGERKCSGEQEGIGTAWRGPRWGR